MTKEGAREVVVVIRHSSKFRTLAVFRRSNNNIFYQSYTLFQQIKIQSYRKLFSIIFLMIFDI